MATSFGALCDDFYINLKLGLKLDLPSERETVLHLFDAVRRLTPSMDRFRRFEDELSLESSRREPEYRWLALRRSSVRSGHVNPKTLEDAGDFHRMVLEMSPFHLTISPIDVDFIEVLYGFDLECRADHDQIVYEALMAETGMGDLLQVEGARPLDVQPIFGMSLSKTGDLQAYFEVKTRTRSRRGSGKSYRNEPIGVFLTLRKYGPVQRVEELVEVYNDLHERGEWLATEKLLPALLNPIARKVQAGSG